MSPRARAHMDGRSTSAMIVLAVAACGPKPPAWALRDRGQSHASAPDKPVASIDPAGIDDLDERQVLGALAAAGDRAPAGRPPVRAGRLPPPPRPHPGGPALRVRPAAAARPGAGDPRRGAPRAGRTGP